MSGRSSHGQLEHPHEIWEAVLLKSLHIFVLFIASARVQLSTSITTDPSRSVPGQRISLAHNPAQPTR